MTEPQIKYVKTEDGVSIAYYAIGQGPPLLFLTMPISHLEAEWQIDPLRLGFIATAQQSTLVRLDPRGFGLSDRDPDDFAVDSLVLDIEAVVDRLGLNELRIYSIGFAAVPALTVRASALHVIEVDHLALAHPERTDPAGVTKPCGDAKGSRPGKHCQPILKLPATAGWSP